MNKTLIFSDVHLKVSPEDRPRHREFCAFLEAHAPPEFDRIICVGDLFDFWFEYKHAVFSGYFDVLRAFAALRDAGAELHLICGNHDFWAGRFLEDELGFNIHKNAVDLPFGGKTVHFVHGDGIDSNDHVYYVYKSIARNPIAVSLFRLIHPDWAMGIARAVSHLSRTLKSPPDPATGPNAVTLRAHAKRLLAEGKAETVICGHAHAPACESYPTPSGEGVYINTGDWIGHRTYAIWDGENFHLEGPRI